MTSSEYHTTTLDSTSTIFTPHIAAQIHQKVERETFPAFSLRSTSLDKRLPKLAGHPPLLCVVTHIQLDICGTARLTSARRVLCF